MKWYMEDGSSIDRIMRLDRQVASVMKSAIIGIRCTDFLLDLTLL